MSDAPTATRLAHWTNGQTTIELWHLTPAGGRIQLKQYDAVGQLIETPQSFPWTNEGVAEARVIARARAEMASL